MKRTLIMIGYSLSILLNCNAISAPYHSQHGQDKFIHQNFFPNTQHGIFVEIGANDGVTFSNTLFFEKTLQWSGICIEPIPARFIDLQKNRHCICVNGCIANDSLTKDFLLVTGYSEMLSGLLEKYDPRHLARIERELKEHGGNQEVIKVQCYMLENLLHEYGISKVDYLSIDTEGGELEILKSIDYTSIIISIISVENAYNTSDIRKFMISKGYEYVTKIGADEIFKLKSH